MQCIIMPCTVSAFCETHGCTNRIKWAIGNQAAPRSRMHICGKCAHDLVDSLPEELLPKVACQEPEPELDPELEPGNNPGEKVYTCDYCGEIFHRPTDKGNHTRKCPQNPKNQAQGGE